jgi:hypothetical protein
LRPLLQDTLKLQSLLKGLHAHLESQQEVVMKALDKKVR